MICQVKQDKKWNKNSKTNFQRSSKL